MAIHMLYINHMTQPFAYDSLIKLPAQHADEAADIITLTENFPLNAQQRQAISERTASLVTQLREEHAPTLLEKFLTQYTLSTEEGIALMCLAEAYLRTPDAETLDALIADKIGGSDWTRHRGKAQSALVNTSTWALMLTGRVFKAIPANRDDLASLTRGMIQRLGEPVVRAAVKQAMKLMGKQFVLGRTIEEALKEAKADDDAYYSFDMLGEAAKTAADAQQYFDAYLHAIKAISATTTTENPHHNNGISVKLSALHPRYQTRQAERLLEELPPKLLQLAIAAKDANIALAMDAEEADRLELSLAVFETLLQAPELVGWNGLTLVVQAYNRRAQHVLHWLDDATKRHSRRVAVRLVKGAYWDSEIKHAQVLGLTEGYPVYTRKAATDAAYLVCAKQLLDIPQVYPQFATHNAHTILAINALGGDKQYEFQRLHGMGDELHTLLAKQDGKPRRVYAPVGVHQDLLAYLVRRLLENGANSSFVNQLQNQAVAPDIMAEDPVDRLAKPARRPLPLPAEIFSDRVNSVGVNVDDPQALSALHTTVKPYLTKKWRYKGKGDAQTIRNPANQEDVLGTVHLATPATAKKALATAKKAERSWVSTPTDNRAACLFKAADLLEQHTPELLAILIREAGKSWDDGINEIREAVDFLRYYAVQGKQLLDAAKPLGTVACISPWNFPLAIFLGQISAALMAGNTVVAKPAEQTPIIAERAIQLLHKAGIPKAALQLVHGAGKTVGAALTSDTNTDGVIFTGSLPAAVAIDRALAKANPAAPLIAETGGINAMIVDSTALPEQTVTDIIASAFQSAGQRCSALRLLLVQEDIAEELLEMLRGAAAELRLGEPVNPANDIGPVIDMGAKQKIDTHIQQLRNAGQLLWQLPEVECNGHFVAPAAATLNNITDMQEEIFGPVLHIVTFEEEELETLVPQVNALGYGLTLGLHSRIDHRTDELCHQAEIGNIYINRNQIGAIVCSQPFGGEGMSGTGPKAGGPLYMPRLVQGITDWPDTQPQVLPGVTGERNTYVLEPRNKVLCLGPDVAAQQALLTEANIEGVTAADYDNEDAALNDPAIELVLYDGDELPRIRQTLAAREGKRVLVVDGFSNPALLFNEKTISEDTTAAGGNASLLAASE